LPSRWLADWVSVHDLFGLKIGKRVAIANTRRQNYARKHQNKRRFHFFHYHFPHLL
jgi:hypothetical protein